MSPFQSGKAAKRLTRFHSALFQKPQAQEEVAVLLERSHEAQSFRSYGDTTGIRDHGLASTQVFQLRTPM